jgi:hypothetical protein
VNDTHDDWGTISREFASRNERLGTRNSVIRVRCATFQSILRAHDIPYYLKIDIEGADTVCLKALEAFEDRPRYISIEASLGSFADAFDELSLLWHLGYRQFKIVNQALNATVRCPHPPLEGVYVDYRFDGTCSGPFGEEAPGAWMSIEETVVRFRRVLAEQRYFGAAGRFHHPVFRAAYQVLRGEPVGWYDFHAKHESR